MTLWDDPQHLPSLISSLDGAIILMMKSSCILEQNTIFGFGCIAVNAASIIIVCIDGIDSQLLETNMFYGL